VSHCVCVCLSLSVCVGVIVCVSQCLCLSLSANFINNWLGAYEEGWYWESVSFFNDTWLSAINGRMLVPHEFAGHFVGQIEAEESLTLPKKLINPLKHFFGDKIKIIGSSGQYSDYMVVDEPSKKQLYILKEAKMFLEEAKFAIKYPMEIALFKSNKILGTADSDRILLSVEVFERGKKTVVETIIEEAIHLETNLKDETRELQDHLINRVVGLLEDKTGIIL